MKTKMIKARREAWVIQTRVDRKAKWISDWDFQETTRKDSIESYNSFCGQTAVGESAYAHEHRCGLARCVPLYVEVSHEA